MQERWERQRYLVLDWVYANTGPSCDRRVNASVAAEETRLGPEEVFRSIEYLADRGYVRYVGPGPQVCITREGLEYLQRRAWRRRSIRDGERLTSA